MPQDALDDEDVLRVVLQDPDHAEGGPVGLGIGLSVGPSMIPPLGAETEALVEQEAWGSWSTNLQRNRRRWAPGSRDLAERSLAILKDRMRKWWAVGIHVGAGPSLDRNLDQLARVYRRGDQLPDRESRCAIIFASDAALKPMLAAGIVPDYVVALDEHQATARFFEGIDQGGMTLLASMTALPDVVEAFLQGWKGGRNRVLFWGNDNDNVRGGARAFYGLSPATLPEIPWLRALDSSVTLMSVEAASYMGLRHHFLLGCDFAVQPDATHCRGFAVGPQDFLVDPRKPSAGTMTPEAYRARVTRSFAVHLRRLNGLHHADLPIYNCTEGGALEFNNMVFLNAAERFGFARRA